MLGLGYWPSRITKGKEIYGFDLSLLGLAQNIQLEAHVSLKAFVEAVAVTNKLSVQQVGIHFFP